MARLRALWAVCVFAVGLRLGLAQHLPVICPLRRFAGIPCASCGLTRAAVALCHGQLATASEQNIAAIPLAVILLAGLVLLGWEAATQRGVVGPVWRRYSGPLIWITVGFMLAAWSLNLYRHFIDSYWHCPST